MKTLLQVIAGLLARRRTPSIEEQYLAQAINANDFEVRLQALERARPRASRSPCRDALASRSGKTYIGRNRWPNARLTFNGRCKPRTARL